MMSKHQIIDEIRKQNRSAAVAFLTSFDEQDLHSYLQRLTRVNGQRGRASVWVRQSKSPAVVARLH